MQRNVALKIEKKDKNKNILMFEYNVLNCLKGKSIDSLYYFLLFSFIPNSLFNRTQARVQCLWLREEPGTKPHCDGSTR